MKYKYMVISIVLSILVFVSPTTTSAENEGVQTQTNAAVEFYEPDQLNQNKPGGIIDDLKDDFTKIPLPNTGERQSFLLSVGVGLGVILNVLVIVLIWMKNKSKKECTHDS